MITKEDIIEICKSYEDPELFIDIWTLGLVYDINIKDNDVHIKLTFTSPMCPFGPQMVDELKDLVTKKGAGNVDIEVTFDPPWKPSDELREMMGV
jgi:metal-sulfur cluster biosynthetic enzyme